MAILRALLAFGDSLVQRRPDQKPEFTPDQKANAFVLEDPFAFLVAVIFDQGIQAERAWAALAAARRLHPERPGQIDYPAWEIGRTWCGPEHPACPACVLEANCPKLISRGDHVRGV
jgi:endonuclease III